MPHRRSPSVTLASATYGFVLVTVLALSLVASAVFFSRSDRLLDGALDTVVRVRTSAAGAILGRTLNEDWQALGRVAATVAGTSPTGRRVLLDTVRGDGRHISWVGYTDTAGRVLAASGGLLEGADVSGRDWFREGLRGSFAGDVHEAVLLAKLLQTPDGAPPRFIDLARAVRGADGVPIGVVGMHIDADWLVAQLAETGEMLEIDLFLISQSGEVLAAPDDTMPTETELALLGVARTGQAARGRAVWPDGETYFTSLLPSVGYGELPSFGWRLAGRLDGAAFAPTWSTLLGNVWFTALVAALLLAVITAGYVILFIRPLQRMARSAARIAAGDEGYPEESASTREAAQLTEALSRLQAERINRPDA